MIKTLCQSCGVPMENFSDFGTDKDGRQSMEYCRNCFQGGFFTNPYITMEEQINKMTNREMSANNISEYDAKKKFNTLIPTLDRWNGISQKSTELEQKKNIKVMIAFAGVVLLFAITTFIFTGSDDLTTHNPSNGDNDDSVASFIALGVVIFVSIINAKRGKKQKHPDATQQRKVLTILILATLLAIGMIVFLSLQK